MEEQSEITAENTESVPKSVEGGTAGTDEEHEGVPLPSTAEGTFEDIEGTEATELTEGTEGTEGGFLEEGYDEDTDYGESEADTATTTQGQSDAETDVADEQVAEEEQKKEEAVIPQTKEDEELMAAEEEIAEEPPPDPAAPYNLSDSKEALKAPFELEEYQLNEVKELWALYQDYTPAYAELKDYITFVECEYMLNALNLQTHTPEQLWELIFFCVRPPHPDHHIEFEHFLHIVTIRQRDMPIEEEIRLALYVMDKDHTGVLDREQFREVIGQRGDKMAQKMLDAFVKEVDVAQDGTLTLEDIVGTMCIDLNREDIDLLLNQINPPEEMDPNIDTLTAEPAETT